MATALQPERPQSSSQDENNKYEDLSLGLLNINGLRNKTHEIRHIIARDKLHAVALCETRLNSSVEHSDVYIPGFSLWRKDKNDMSNNKGGGVALYVQDHIKTRLRPDLMNLDPTSFTPVKAETDQKDPEVDKKDPEVDKKDPEVDKKDPEVDKKDPKVEIIWVELDLPDSPVLLGCCYIRKKNKTIYLNLIKETIRQISEGKEQKNIFLMGDFNIDWLSDSEKKEADDFISKNGWKQIVKVPTRVTLDSLTCIDHIYTNISDTLKPESILTGCSDHNLITVKIERKIPQRKENFRSNKFEKKEFQKDVKNKWKKAHKDIQSLEEFTNVILQVAEEHAPLQKQDFYCLLKLDTQLESFVSKRDEIKVDMIINIYHSIKEKKKLQEQIDNRINGKLENPPEGGNDATESEETFPFHLPKTEKHQQETTDSGSVVGQKKIKRSGGQKDTRLAVVKSCLEFVCDHVIKVIDETEAELWKPAAEFISDPIRHILNGYINTGEFPDELKKIKSFPFSTDSYINIRQKSGAERVHIILNYIFDVILYQQFKKPFIGNEENTLEEKLKQPKTDRLPVEAVLLDFTSYFDTISHKDLIPKLEESEFSGSDLELIKSFLSIQEDSSGLPAGSCLAQLLRIIIINDLKKTVEPSAVICNNYMMIYGNKTEIDEKKETVNEWVEPFNIEMRRKLFEPSELSAMFKILESMVRCHGDESNWIRAPGNIVKQNGDWEYDNISKELELHFGKKYKVEPENVNNSQQKSQTRNPKHSKDSAGDNSSSRGTKRREI